jgi:hypothetical protein
LELGVPSKNIPPRPLFFPAARGISKSIYRHFLKFLGSNHPGLLKLI